MLSTSADRYTNFALIPNCCCILPKFIVTISENNKNKIISVQVYCVKYVTVSNCGILNRHQFPLPPSPSPVGDGYPDRRVNWFVDVIGIEPTPHELKARCSPVELHIINPPMRGIQPPRIPVGRRGSGRGLIPDVVRIEPTPHELTTRCSPVELHIINPPMRGIQPPPNPRRPTGIWGILGMMMRLELNQQPIGLQPFALPLSYTSSKSPPRPKRPTRQRRKGGNFICFYDHFIIHQIA